MVREYPPSPDSLKPEMTVLTFPNSESGTALSLSAFFQMRTPGGVEGLEENPPGLGAPHSSIPPQMPAPHSSQQLCKSVTPASQVKREKPEKCSYETHKHYREQGSEPCVLNNVTGIVEHLYTSSGGWVKAVLNEFSLALGNRDGRS